MLINLLPKFKVVEINNVAALRMGHVIAQTPAYATAPDAETPIVASTEAGEYQFIENGIIVGLDKTGVLANYDPKKHVQPCLVYTEELITANYVEGLDQFAELVPGAKKPVYPRALPLNLGDTFTTNNVSEVKDGFAYVNAGVLTVDEAYTAGKHMFIAKVSNLPAGQNAVEFTYIGLTAPAANAGE